MNSETAFSALGLSKKTLSVIEKRGFTKASEVQVKTIPVILEGKQDLIAIAKTGTGKTAAFALPLIEQLGKRKSAPRVLILVPTRELAIQVAKECSLCSTQGDLGVLSVYGGQNIMQQIKELRSGVDIIVATPGRTLDLLSRNELDLKKIEVCVLDEADEMLKMGFIDDLEAILEATPKKKRTYLFSATMPDRIRQLSKKYLDNPVSVQIKSQDGVETAAGIRQIYYRVRHSDKEQAISRIIDAEDFFYGIIFCKTKVEVDELTSYLRKSGYDANCIHGDITQNRREKILRDFREQRISILVATDVAARGIDVKDLTHVINHSLPQEHETYVHRIGRTGRAGKTGIAITLLTPREASRIRELERSLGTKLEEAQLPNLADAAKKKEGKVKSQIEDVIANRKAHAYEELAKSLLSESDPQSVVAALLMQLDAKKHAAPQREREDFSREDRRDSRRGGYERKSSFRSRGDERPQRRDRRDSYSRAPRRVRT